MRHVRKFSDDYGLGRLENEGELAAVLGGRDIDEIVDTYGDDWSLDSDEVDIELLH